MVRDRFYNGGVVLQYLLTISVFFHPSKTLLTHFLSAFGYLIFVTNCNDIHMHHEKGKSHSLAPIHFQGCKCRGRVACKYPRYSRRTSVAPLDLWWPGLLGKLRQRTPISPVKRDRRGPRWFFKYGGELSISRCKKIKKRRQLIIIQLYCD